jgi:acetyl-CoA synthetase
VVCFVVLRRDTEPSETLRGELLECVVRHLGKTLRPEALHFVAALPKTRSAKIVRGAIRRRYLGEPLGDTASIDNPDALAAIPTSGG